MPGELALAYLAVFVINLAPAFMPPTWAVLAFFLISFHLPLLPLALGGAIAASAGRVALALASRRWGRALLSRRRRENLAELGGWLDEKARWAAPVAMLLYSFGPIPSNQLFIAAGLTRLRLLPIAGAFFVGRILSYTFWVSSAHLVVDRFEDIFVGRWRDGVMATAELLLLALLIAFTRIDWPRVLRSSAAGLPGRP